MPSIDKKFLLQLKEDYTKYKCFVETGTLYGGTIFSMEPLFDKLYTIEYSEQYYNNTKKLYTGNKIDFILGDSSKVFVGLLPTISEKCIFFLDGHWSSGDTGKSDKDCPLIEEIEQINSLFLNEAIIIIDDYRLFGQSPKTGAAEDWGSITKDSVLYGIQSRITNVYHLDSDISKDDRLIIHIKSLL